MYTLFVHVSYNTNIFIRHVDNIIEHITLFRVQVLVNQHLVEERVVKCYWVFHSHNSESVEKYKALTGQGPNSINIVMTSAKGYYIKHIRYQLYTSLLVNRSQTVPEQHQHHQPHLLPINAVQQESRTYANIEYCLS